MSYIDDIHDAIGLAGLTSMGPAGGLGRGAGFAASINPTRASLTANRLGFGDFSNAPPRYIRGPDGELYDTQTGLRTYDHKIAQLQYETMKKEQARKDQILGALLGGGVRFNLDAGSIPTVDTGYRQTDVQSLINRLNEFSKGASGQEQMALRDQGMQGLQQQYLSSLSGIRALNGRATPSSLVRSREADLLKSRLSAQKDLESNLITSELDRRQQTMNLLNDVVGSDISRVMGGQQSNMNRGLNIAQIQQREQESIRNALLGLL